MTRYYHNIRCDHCGKFISKPADWYVNFGSYGDTKPPDEIFLCEKCLKEEIDYYRKVRRMPHHYIHANYEEDLAKELGFVIDENSPWDEVEAIFCALESMHNQYNNAENNTRAMIVENTMLHEKIIELNKKIAFHDDTIRKLKDENEQLIRSFCEYETICADGEVGASVVNMKNRIDELEIELACRDDVIKRLNEKLHEEMAKLEIAAAGNKRLIIALNEIYINGERHNANWCKRKAQEGLGLIRAQQELEEK